MRCFKTLSVEKYSIAILGQDLLASSVVFLVALPLCMGIAIASGMSPAAGLITGIIGGVVVAPLSGCPLQVSGPAAGLAVIIFELSKKYGLEYLGFVIVIAGFIQIFAGFSKSAQWFRAVPPAVIHGMLSGIGVLLFASQFHVMVDDIPGESGLLNLTSIPNAILKGISFSSPTGHFQPCMIGLTAIAVMLTWNSIKDRSKSYVVKLIPGSLLAILITTILAFALRLDINYVSLPDSLIASINLLNPSKIGNYAFTEVVLNGLAVAFIAAAETLLTATAVDKLHKGDRTNYDRELVALGVGNTICGFLGGLPMTGVMVRSGINISAGAKTRLSSFFHGLWLLLFVAFLPFLLERIPTSALAALLVYTGWNLANFQVVKELSKYGRFEAVVYASTVVGIVTFDLLIGVIIGVLLALLKLIYIFSHLDISIEDDISKNQTKMFLQGSATFLSLPKLVSKLETIRENTELHIHLERLDYIDHACLDAIMSWEELHLASGGLLIIDWGSLEAAFSRRARGVSASDATERKDEIGQFNSNC